MANLWLKIRIWTKIIVISVLVLYVIVFVYNNAQNPVKIWYWFGRSPETNLLLVVLCSFLAGVIVAFLARTTVKTINQVQELKDRARTQKMDRDMADIRAKAAMLQTKQTPVVAPVPESVTEAPPKPHSAPIETLEDRTQM